MSKSLTKAQIAQLAISLKDTINLKIKVLGDSMPIVKTLNNEEKLAGIRGGRDCYSAR